MKPSNFRTASPESLPWRCYVVFVTAVIFQTFVPYAPGPEREIVFWVSIPIALGISLIAMVAEQERFRRIFGFVPTLDLFFGYLFKSARQKRLRSAWKVERELRSRAWGIKHKIDERSKALVRNKLTDPQTKDVIDRGRRAFCFSQYRGEIGGLIKEYRWIRDRARIFGFSVFESWVPWTEDELPFVVEENEP